MRSEEPGRLEGLWLRRRMNSPRWWAPGKGRLAFISQVGKRFSAVTTGSSHPITQPGTTSSPDFQKGWKSPLRGPASCLRGFYSVP